MLFRSFRLIIYLPNKFDLLQYHVTMSLLYLCLDQATVHGHCMGNCEEELPKKPVGRLSADRSVSSRVCRVIHHHYGILHHVNCSCLPQFSFFLNLSVTCWLAVGRLSVTCRSTDGRQLTDSRPTGFLGALLHNYHCMQTFYMYSILTHENRIQKHFRLPYLHLSESLVKQNGMKTSTLINTTKLYIYTLSRCYTLTDQYYLC